MGDIFCTLGVSRLGVGALWMWESDSLTVCSEFFHFSVTVGPVLSLCLSSVILLVIILCYILVFGFLGVGAGWGGLKPVCFCNVIGIGCY